MSYIKVIVINPIAKTVEAMDMLNDFTVMKRDYIKCQTAEVMDLGGGVDAWFDEEGMLTDWDTQGFTNFAGAVTLAGNIVLAGRDAEKELDNLPADIDLEFVRSMAIWVPAKNVKVRGSSFTTFEDGKTPVTKAIGPEWLTYENH